MSNTLKRFLLDTGWSFASLAVATLVQFVLRIFLARYYGPADLGLYTLAFTVYSFGLIFSGFGIGAGVTKYVAEKKENSAQVSLFKTSGIFTSFLTGVITAVILYISAPYIAAYFFKMPELTKLLQIVSFVLPFIALEKATLGYLRGIRRMRLFAFINITQYLLIIILTIILALTGHDISYAVIGFVAPTILLSLVSLFCIYNSLPKLRFQDYLPSIKILLSFGFFVVLANSMGMIQSYTDSTLLGYYMTSTDVGLYSVALTLAQVISLPPSAIQTISSPTIATFWGRKEINNIENLINQCMKYTALYAVLIAFIIGCLSQDIIKLLYGVDYIAVAFPLQIMLAGAVFNAIQISVGGALSSTAYVKILFILTGLTVLLNIILNVLLIPRFGITGAAIASSATVIITIIIHIYFTQRLIKIRIDWLWFAKLFGVTIIIAVGTYFVARFFNLYAAAAAGIIVLILVLLRYFTTVEDRKLIRGILRIPDKKEHVKLS
jgi:stage V sporulation protein B